MRRVADLLLPALAGLALVVGVVALYARTQLTDRDAFADRAVAAISDDAVRDVVSRQVVVALAERGSADLLSVRPLLQEAVEVAATTPAFRRTVRVAAASTHELLFERGESGVVFDLADVSTVVLSALRSVAPDVARRVPAHVDAELLDLRDRPFATDTIAVADDVRRVGWALPLLALALALVAVGAAADRRRAIARLGLWIGGTALALGVALTTARTLVLDALDGIDTIPASDVRAAGGGVWDAYLGDLDGLLMVCATVGFVAAAAALVLDERVDVRALATRLARRPASPPLAVARALALLAAGIAATLWPAVALAVAARLVGALLVFVAFAELLAALDAPRRRRPEARRLPRLALVPAVALLALGGASAAAALVLERDPPRVEAAPTPEQGCNGSRALCAKRLNEALFAGTHNSMSAADSPGWLLANQRRDVERQLGDGIRLFLIDPHYGRQSGGRVATDFQAERRDANRVGRELSPAAQRALARLGPSLGLGRRRGGPRDVWLCHSVCELGATRMTDALADLRRFLDREPQTVLVLILESYVAEDDLQRAFARAGLSDELAVLDRSQPLPTLGRLIADRKRIVAFTEHPPSGRHPQLNDAFAWIQDTPLGATEPRQLSCRRERGDAASPILMLNHWIDRFPPPPSRNRQLLTAGALRKRIAACERARRMPVALIASDFYDLGPFATTIERIAAER